jgi:hypothetical protein
MNERIAKLYDQAIVIEDGGDYVCGELDPEKFAELIIRECFSTVELILPCYLGYRDHIENACRRDCVAEIKHKFGVEL